MNPNDEDDQFIDAVREDILGTTLTPETIHQQAGYMLRAMDANDQNALRAMMDEFGYSRFKVNNTPEGLKVSMIRRALVSHIDIKCVLTP